MSPLTHMEQLLLVTSCDSPEGIGANLRTDAQRTSVGNSILDCVSEFLKDNINELLEYSGLKLKQQKSITPSQVFSFDFVLQ